MERVIRPTLLHLADRIATRLRAKSRPGRTVTVRVRFADLRRSRARSRSTAPISATVMLAELAEDLVRAALADHPEEKTISLLAISVSHLEEHWDLALELPLGLDDEARRPGSRIGLARWTPTAPSTGSAIASDGMRSDTARLRSECPARCPTISASLPRRNSDEVAALNGARRWLCGSHAQGFAGEAR